MNLESFTGPGSTPSRRRFWDKVAQSVLASQKVAGRNVSVQEYQGQGTVINIADNRRSSGACPPGDLVLTFADVVIACGCLTAEPIWRSLEVTEDAGINSPFTVPSAPGDVCGTPCEWDLLGQFGLVTDQPYNNSDCTDPISVGATAVAFFVTLISGTFRVLVISDAGLFFGSAAFSGTFPVVISNTLSCTADVQTLNVGCDFSSIITFVGVGGTCTITQP